MEEIGVMLADPADRPPDLYDVAVAQPDLPDRATLLAGQ
jgi:hypothetical protein